ncbi:MAG: UvrD-helicase domain-containing protein [Deltaproteobacteria bacterium]|nr:UvrD-helicase domain-containing protein [Deltaproteobacteria bacterium]
MSRWFQNLNPEQRRAVELIHGPLLVLAGAGSGKTRVITHRIAYMLEQGVAPDELLAVTFTNKAAEEMAHRLSKMIGPRANKVTLCTFHALGLSMLKAEAKRGPRARRFAIFDTGDQLATLKEATRRLHLERAFDLGSVLARISSYKNAFVLPGAVAESEDPYDQAASLLYPIYEELLESYAAVDFDDLVCRPVRLMEEDEACRARWAERYRYVLVDEYQDSNAAQLRMLRALAGEHRNLCVVGDDDQSIYGWRGAQVENILHFERHFPGAKSVFLLRNYRSVPSVLDLANRVIAQNPDRREKELKPTRQDAGKVRLVVCPDGDAEVAWVGRHARKMIDLGRYRPGQMAVLFRSNILARTLEAELRAQGIPYRVLGGQAFFEAKEIKDLIAYLRVCHNPADELALRRVINFPTRGIGTRTLAKLSEWAEQQGTSFFQALKHAEEVLGAGDRAAEAVADFLSLVERSSARFKRGESLAEGVRALVGELQLEAEIRTAGTSDKGIERRLAHLAAFVAGVESYCKRVEKPSLGDYLNRVALAGSGDDPQGGPGDRLTLSTLHGSKGLEFPLVMLVGLEEGLLPHDRTLNPHQNDHDTGDIAEERRLCYVGITRAMNELVLTRCRERLLRGKLQPRAQSRFLDGIPTDLFDLEDLASEPPLEVVKGMMAEIWAKLGAAPPT